MSFGVSRNRSTSVVYVSWNGATEVRSWQFWAGEGANEIFLGEKKKLGFETRFDTEGYYSNVWARAMSVDGTALGRSKLVYIQPQDHWDMHGTADAPRAQLAKEEDEGARSLDAGRYSENWTIQGQSFRLALAVTMCGTVTAAFLHALRKRRRSPALMRLRESSVKDCVLLSLSSV